MGKVRTRVRLVNFIDEVLANRGYRKQDEVRTYEADALVDTGAARSIVPLAVLNALGLETDGEAVVTLADGRQSLIQLSDAVRFEILERDTVEEAMVLGDEVVIGQTVLEKLDLRVDCKNQKVIPNPAHPNGPVFRV